MSANGILSVTASDDLHISAWSLQSGVAHGRRRFLGINHSARTNRATTRLQPVYLYPSANRSSAARPTGSADLLSLSFELHVPATVPLWASIANAAGRPVRDRSVVSFCSVSSSSLRSLRCAVLEGFCGPYGVRPILS